MTTQGSFAESIVWQVDEDGLYPYHVYGLTVSTQGTILAFSEARLRPADDDPHHIALKRSVDGGATWSENQILVASAQGECWAQPTALIDERSGTIFLFYCLNHANNASQVFFIRSDDDGLTWSSPLELTSLFDNNPYGWTLHMPGPGHGLQLRNGRLLLQLWHRTHITDADGRQIAPEDRNYGNSVLYSDDGGATWQLSAPAPKDRACMNNESRLVELTNGDVLLLARSSGTLRHKRLRRVVSLSHDSGLTWSQPEYHTAMPPLCGCDAGLARLTWPEEGKSRIVYCYPNHPEERMNLTVSVSYDECASWIYSKRVTDQQSCYSDMAILPDRTMVCLYGKGRPPGERYATWAFPREVVCARFDLAWLTDGQDGI